VVFQSAALLNWLSLEGNVALNLWEHTALAPSIIDLIVGMKAAVVRGHFTPSKPVQFRATIPSLPGDTLFGPSKGC